MNHRYIYIYEFVDFPLQNLEHGHLSHSTAFIITSIGNRVKQQAHSRRTDQRIGSG